MSRTAIGVIIGLFGAGLTALVIWMWGAQLFTFFWVTIRPGFFVLALFAAAIAFGAFAVYRAEGGDTFAVWVLVAIVSFLAAIFLWVKIGYDTDRQYVADIELTEKAVPSFDERAPLKVAVLSSARNLQNTTGEAQITKSLADQGETGQWNTLVVYRGLNVGYESVQSINTPLFGSVSSGDVTLCDFNNQYSLRMGGALPHNNLHREILWNTPADVSYDGYDVYSYCDEKTGTPFVIVPLKQLEGWYAAHWTAYGVAVYNGETGELDIITDSKKIAAIPGPVYPLTLAETQRNATHAMGSWWDYLMGVSGYENTADDDGDPNAGNRSEFALRDSATKKVSYVSPLTPRGDSTTIVGLSTVAANVVVHGERNPIVIHTFKDGDTRKANSSVADDVRTKYSWMPEMASDDNKIFEIVPSSSGNWVVSIGREQSVAYRAIVEPDGTITLYNREGQVVTQANPSGAGSDKPTDVDLSGNLDEMSSTELQKLGNLVLEELAKRSASE